MHAEQLPVIVGKELNLFLKQKQKKTELFFLTRYDT